VRSNPTIRRRNPAAQTRKDLIRVSFSARKFNHRNLPPKRVKTVRFERYIRPTALSDSPGGGKQAKQHEWPTGGLLKELQELQPAPGATSTLPSRDVRARRPFLLRAIIRLRTLRSLARVAVLGVLDAGGVFLAIWTALELKAVLRDKSDLTLSFHQAQDVAPPAILVTLLVRALGSLRRPRGAAGLHPRDASLFQATVVVMLFAFV
jgi:hypothetical protein